MDPAGELAQLFEGERQLDARSAQDLVGGVRVRAQLGLRYTPIESLDIDLIYGRNISGENANWITVGLNVRFGTSDK